MEARGAVPADALLVVGGPELAGAARALEADYELRCAEDHACALALLGEGRARFVLAIVDVEAPEVGGLALLRALSLASPPLPALAVLPMRDPSALEQALALGAVEFICGPPHGAALGLRVRNALALQRSREVMDSLHELVFRWTPERGVTFVNGTVLRFLGVCAEDLLGKSLKPFVLEEDRAALHAHLDGLTPEAPTGAVELRVRLPSGEVRWTAWSHRALYVGGRAVEFQSVGRDITEERLAAAQLRASEDAQRALEARLLRARKDEGLGRMAGAIAHTYGSTFGALLGQLELARADDAARRDEVLQDATRTVLRAAELTRALRRYAGGGRPEQVDLDLSQLSREAKLLLTASLGGTARLSVHAPGVGPYVCADPSLLHQALLQLVTNAAESRAGPVQISLHAGVSLRSQLDDGWALFPPDWDGRDEAYAALAVVDDGGGMAPAELERLFEPFASTKALGRGLGLALVLSTARDAGGAVAVATSPASPGCAPHGASPAFGTAVCLLLPLRPPPGLAGAP